MRLLLDTHIILWFITDDKKLSRINKNHVQNAEYLFLSAISLLEVAQLVYYGRVELGYSPHAWTDTVRRELNIDISPVTANIALESYALPGNFHKDPADRLIIATAREQGLTLVTQDKAMLQYARKGHVAIAT